MTIYFNWRELLVFGNVTSAWDEVLDPTSFSQHISHQTAKEALK